MASKAQRNSKKAVSTPTKAQATPKTPVKATTTPNVTPDPEPLTLDQIRVKHAAGTPLEADEALTLIRAKHEAERSAEDKLRLAEADMKATIKALRKAVRVEKKTLATTGTEKLISDYVTGGFQRSLEEIDADTPAVGIESLIDAIHALNPNRTVKRLTVRYSVGEDGKADTKISFKLAQNETKADTAQAAS